MEQGEKQVANAVEKLNGLFVNARLYLPQSAVCLRYRCAHGSAHGARAPPCALLWFFVTPFKVFGVFKNYSFMSRQDSSELEYFALCVLALYLPQSAVCLRYFCLVFCDPFQGVRGLQKFGIPPEEKRVEIHNFDS